MKVRPAHDDRLWPFSYEPRPRPELEIEKDIPPPSKEEMARRLARDAALQHWHTHPEIRVPFEAYWASVKD